MEAAIDMLMEEREASIVVGSTQTRRPAHFIAPSFSSHSPSFDVPTTAFRSTHHNLSGLCPGHVAFPGWKTPLQNWGEWVEHMKPLHHSTWHKAGIYDAVIASTYAIRQDTNLVLALAEKWCPETNTFVFPWGEATISLEDIMILGGFSVLGDSIESEVESYDNEEFTEINEELNKVRSELNNTKAKKTTQGMWMECFMNSGSDVEHEAFLVLWLSRHVFPFAQDVVGKHLHKIAFRLARGTRLALGVPVLACIYRDLRNLKEKIVTLSVGNATQQKLNLWSQMQFAQVWAWERFPKHSPKTNYISKGEPRISSWHNIVRASNVESVRLAIDSFGKDFVWRPYAISERFNFYPKKEKRVPICQDMRQDFKSFCRFIKVSELVGLNSVERYSPHRVSNQFGMDQDIPGEVARFNGTAEIAWNNFKRRVKDKKLYIPSKRSKFGATTNYLKWWNNAKSITENILEDHNNISLGTFSRNSKKNKSISEDIETSKSKKLKKMQND